MLDKCMSSWSSGLVSIALSGAIQTMTRDGESVRACCVCCVWARERGRKETVCRQSGR